MPRREVDLWVGSIAAKGKLTYGKGRQMMIATQYFGDDEEGVANDDAKSQFFRTMKFIQLQSRLEIAYTRPQMSYLAAS
jgi:hypothetical protein